MLQDTARLRVVPCGDTPMVWRAWGGGRPLVLLHGGHGSWTHWCRNIDALSRAGREVWVPDLPGFGDSPPLPGAEDADDLVSALGDALSTLFGDRPVDLVAFSFGAIVAGLLASSRPHSIGKLVLVGATGLGLVTPPPPLRSWRRAADDQERMSIHGSNLAALMLHRLDPEDAEAVRLQAANVERAKLASLRLSHSDVLLRALRSVHCDVHGIWGEHDALYRGQLASVESALRALPAFRHFAVVPGAGHWVQYEAPRRFHVALQQALADARGAAGGADG